MKWKKKKKPKVLEGTYSKVVKAKPPSPKSKKKIGMVDKGVKAIKGLFKKKKPKVLERTKISGQYYERIKTDTGSKVVKVKKKK